MAKGNLNGRGERKALRCIDNEDYLGRWIDRGEKVYKKSKEVLETLRYKLHNEKNPEKKINKCPAYYRTKTKWKVGDLVAYKVNTRSTLIYDKKEDITEYQREIIKAEDLVYQKYVLLRVIEVYKRPVTELYPELDYTSSAVCMLYDWIGDEIPESSVVNTCKFIHLMVRCDSVRCIMVSKLVLNIDRTSETKIIDTDKDLRFKESDLYVENSDCPIIDSDELDRCLIHYHRKCIN